MQVAHGSTITGSAMRMRCPHIMFTRTARVVVAHGTQRNRPYKWHSPKTGDNVKETIKQAAGDAVQQLGSAMQAALDKVPSPKPTRKASGATPALPPSEGDDSLVSSSEDESPPHKKGFWDRYPTIF
ncbi:MAG: hypothetical protein WDW36_007472 [Sanguina aurantia]